MKSIFASKTFWLNILTISASIADIVPPSAQKYMLPALAIGNITLRTFTNQPVNILPAEKPPQQ